MKLDARLEGSGPAEIAAAAREAEALGLDGLWTHETQHDPFLPLAIAAEHTRRVEMGTAIAVAFARSPMVVAHTAWDLARWSGGRFLLGLGTQVRGHNERRFSVKWDAPGPRLREYVLALRAIWECWQNGTPLKFEGRFYTHTLMTPFFNPGPHPTPRIPVWIAAVNPYLCRVAGEVADGLHVHPFHTTRYIREAVLPHVADGARTVGRRREDIALGTSVFVVTGRTEAELAAVAAPVREQIAFYASTKSYWPVLEVHGWGEAGGKLNRLAAAGRWNDMAALVTDEMLHEFAIVAPHAELGARVMARYRGLLDRAFLYLDFPAALPRDCWSSVVAACHT
jgi:probable F420-dependent oxidoreductase